MQTPFTAIQHIRQRKGEDENLIPSLVTCALQMKTKTTILFHMAYIHSDFITFMMVDKCMRPAPPLFPQDVYCNICQIYIRDTYAS